MLTDAPNLLLLKGRSSEFLLMGKSYEDFCQAKTERFTFQLYDAWFHNINLEGPNKLTSQNWNDFRKSCYLVQVSVYYI